MTFVVLKRKPLVYIEPARKYYARYIGRQCFGAFCIERELDGREVELFRTNPECFLSPEAIDPLTPPEAA